MNQAAYIAHRMFSSAAWALNAGRPVHVVTLKSRARIQREIARERQGWWADVAAGQTLVLTDATAEDLARCTLNASASRDPADYYVECFERGALVSRIAAEHVTTLTIEASSV